MAISRVIHLARPRKERNGNLAAKSKQKSFNTNTYGSNPSISHKPWRLPQGFAFGFLLAAGIVVEQLFE